jgi:hypothetical protein
MKKLFLLILVSNALLAQNTPASHEFVIANFRTESGVTLPQASIV